MFFENLLRSREEKLQSLQAISAQFDAVSTELKNSRLLESHLQSEVGSLKGKCGKLEEKIRELKDMHFKQAAELRQTSRQLEAKQVETEQKEQAVQRIKVEVAELQNENKELRKSIGEGDHDREILVQKIRRLETEIVKRDAKIEQMNRENRRSKGGEEIDCSIDFFGKRGCRDLGRIDAISSLESVLMPFELKSSFEQKSPFSSAKTMNKTVKYGQAWFSDSNDKNSTAKLNRNKQNISYSYQTIKDESLLNEGYDERKLYCSKAPNHSK